MKKIPNLKSLIMTGGVDEQDFRGIYDEIVATNRRSVRIFSSVTGLILLAMFVLSLMVSTLSGNRGVYAFFLALSAGVAAYTGRSSADNPGFMMAICYVFLAMLMGIGIALGTVLSPRETTATYIALMLAVPQLFVDRPIRMYALISVSVAVFIGMVFRFKDPITWSSDITNSILFALVSMFLVTYSTFFRVTRFRMEHTIRDLAENDQLTGLKNRNSYELKLQKISILAASSIYCVYVDVNGLHELNNTKGHAAGDRMLQFIASAMQDIFGKKDTYRIGGDEFIALGQDCPLEEINQKIQKLTQIVEAEGYHIAHGVSYKDKKEIEVDSLIKQAEQEMYKDKSEYYRRNGIDRRRNR